MAEIILPLIGPEPRTEAWFAIRRWDPTRKDREIVFGATDAAACCGMSPYRTPLDVYCDAMGLGPERETTEAMLNGLDYEDAVLNIYERKRGVKLQRKLPMFFHGKYKWMGATPDAIVVTGEQEGQYTRIFSKWSYGVDAKTSTYRRLDKEGGDPLKFGREGTDELPSDYLLQGQAQCAVLNLPYVEFPVAFSRDYQPIYRVDRDEFLIGAIINAEQEMYERLLNNDPPEPNWTHANTRELISCLHGYQKDVVKQLDEDDAERWVTVSRKKDEIKTLEEEIRAESNRLLAKLEGAAAGVFPSGEQQLKRIVVKASLWTEKDVEDARAALGTVKRKSYEFLKQTKVKE